MSATFETATDDAGRVLVVRGEIDLANAGELADALAALAGAGGTVTVDLSAAEYLDSAGIKVLFEHAERGRLRVRLPAGSTVAAAIRASHLDRVAEIEAGPLPS